MSFSNEKFIEQKKAEHRQAVEEREAMRPRLAEKYLRWENSYLLKGSLINTDVLGRIYGGYVSM